MAQHSPFPGMDPWLEGDWGDVHHTVIHDLRSQIRRQLPADLLATVEETVYVIEPESFIQRRVEPDIIVVKSPDLTREKADVSAGGVAVAEPIHIELPDEPITQGHIEVRALRQGYPLVTVIEILSPTNKLDPHARAQYLRKREDFYAAKVNVVEIDLLRRGAHLVGVPLESLTEPELRSPYKCVVWTGGQLAGLGVDYYPLPLRQRLPRIRLPLRPTDEEALIDLQQSVDVAYEEGQYAIRLDYTQPPEPPLSSDDAEWAAGMIAAARRTA